MRGKGIAGETKPIAFTIDASHALGAPGGTLRATIDGTDFVATTMHWIVVAGLPGGPGGVG